MEQQLCQAIWCTDRVLLSEVFCERHDRLLQSDIRTLLAKKYRPGERPTKVFLATLERARAEILYAEYAGHRSPRAVEFEW